MQICGMAPKDWFIKNFLIIGLLSVITFGLVCPGPGLALGENGAIGMKVKALTGLSLPDIAVDLIFVVSGIALDSFSAANRPKALILGMVLVLFVTPMLAPLVLLLGQLVPGLNKSLLQGMALFTIVPTTLSSGVTMITQAKGNVSLAILITSATNILGVFTMSWSASRVFSANVAIKPEQMLQELIWLTLVPLVVGMALKRFVKPIQDFAKAYKKPLGLCQNSCILFVVFLMVSKAEAQISVAKAGDLYLCLALAASVHLIYRLIGYFAATAANLQAEEWITVVLMSSQKSLPVCVSVLAALPLELRRNSGLFILPCILAHAAQLIIDSMLAVRWEVKAEKTAPLLPN